MTSQQHCVRSECLVSSINIDDIGEDTEPAERVCSQPVSTGTETWYKYVRTGTMWLYRRGALHKHYAKKTYGEMEVGGQLHEFLPSTLDGEESSSASHTCRFAHGESAPDSQRTEG